MNRALEQTTVAQMFDTQPRADAPKPDDNVLTASEFEMRRHVDTTPTRSGLPNTRRTPNSAESGVVRSTQPNDEPPPTRRNERPARLFVAVTPPANARTELRAATRALRRAHPALRWTHPDDWHVSLAFLGEVPAARVPGLRTELAEVAAAHAPFDLAVSGAGHFRDRVLWAGLAGDQAALEALADATRAAVARCGLVSDEEHPFRAHLTLARAARTDPTGVRNAATRLHSFTGDPWTARQIHLLESRFGRESALSHTIATWPLTA